MKKSFPYLFLSLFFSLPSYAADIDEVIVITADRLAMSELESSYSTDVIYNDEIKKFGMRTTVDAIGSVSGVLLQKTAHGQGSPYIRGFTGFRNLFLIDSVRLNNSTFREGPNQYWNTVDHFSISRYEVVKGPTSVSYGSDAIGGTVNALSRIQSIEDIDTDAPVSLFLRGSSAEQSTQARLSIEKKISLKSAFSFGLSHKNFGDLIAGGKTNEQQNTGYDEFNMDFKWLQTFDNNWQLKGAYFKTRQNDVPRTHKTIDGISFEGTTIGNELKRNLNQVHELAYLKILNDNKNTIFDNAQWTLSMQNQYEDRERLRTQNRSDFQSVDVDTLGLSAQFIKKIQSNKLVYGFEYYADSVNSFSSNNNIQGPVADDANYKWLGIFAQTKYTIDPNLFIDFGLRWNFMSVKANKIADPVDNNIVQLHKNWQHWVGNIRVNYTIRPQQSSFFVGLSQGFRAPNLSDLTRFDSARSNEFEIPSTDLDSEHYVGLDTGFKYRSEQLDFDASLYYTDIKDQIQGVPTGNVNADDEFEISKLNIGDGYVYGSEIDIRYAMTQQFYLLANISYINGKIDTFPDSSQVIQKEYLSRLMPTNAKLGFHFSSESERWWVFAEIIGFAKGDRLSTRDKGDTQRIPPNGTPSYTIINLGSAYNLSESLLFTVNIHNIFDKDYRVHGSGLNEAGINLIGSINYRF